MLNPPHHDPYDLWANKTLGKLKLKWQEGYLFAKIALPIIGVLEIASPNLLRQILRVTRHQYPHIEAMILSANLRPGTEEDLAFFLKHQSPLHGWGLPFAWYSKNGVYESGTPYITNTPYIMEALLTLAKIQELQTPAMHVFNDSWEFLELLHVHKTSPEALALSYAPINEPRIVINANSYAAFAYALHATHGKKDIQETAINKAERLTRWVCQQQAGDGSWLYYADSDPGNFIDCFHSCFVVKNLFKTNKLLPHLAEFTQPAIERGWEYIRSKLYDKKSGLCHRFAQRAQRDPFRWDLYDQAEYLGLLTDFGELEEANAFADHVESLFRKGDHWYCRIDILGRRWGRDFLRWGIVPFLYHKARLQQALNKRGE